MLFVIIHIYKHYKPNLAVSIHIYTVWWACNEEKWWLQCTGPVRVTGLGGVDPLAKPLTPWPYPSHPPQREPVFSPHQVSSTPSPLLLCIGETTSISRSSPLPTRFACSPLRIAPPGQFLAWILSRSSRLKHFQVNLDKQRSIILILC